MISYHFWLFGLLSCLLIRYGSATPMQGASSLFGPSAKPRQCTAEDLDVCMDTISDSKIGTMAEKARLKANHVRLKELHGKYAMMLSHSKMYICGPRVTPPVGPLTLRDAPPDFFETESSSGPKPTRTASASTSLKATNSGTASSVSPTGTSTVNGTATAPSGPAVSQDFCPDLDRCRMAHRKEAEGLEAQREMLAEQERAYNLIDTNLKQCELRTDATTIVRRDTFKDEDGRMPQAYQNHISTCKSHWAEARYYLQYQDDTLGKLRDHSHDKRDKLEDANQLSNFTTLDKEDGNVAQLNEQLLTCQRGVLDVWQQAGQQFEVVTHKYEELGDWKGPGPLQIPEVPKPSIDSSSTAGSRRPRPHHPNDDPRQDGDRRADDSGNIMKRGYPEHKYQKIISSGDDFIANLGFVVSKLADQLSDATEDRNRLGRNSALCTWKHRRCPKEYIDEISGGSDSTSKDPTNSELQKKIKQLEDEKKARELKDVQDHLKRVSEELKQCKAGNTGNTADNTAGIADSTASTADTTTSTADKPTNTAGKTAGTTPKTASTTGKAANTASATPTG